jgi:chloramphenicol O-acetyltransferase
MNGEVGLPVAIQIEHAHAHACVHGALKDARGNLFAALHHRAWQSDLHGD